MKKVDYAIEKKLHDEMMQLQKDAVLYPLVGKVDDTETLTERLREIWLTRLSQFSDAFEDEAPLSGLTEFCDPDFAPSDVEVGPCGLGSVCPFCYARKLTAHWMDFLNTLNQVSQANSKGVHTAYHIVTRSDCQVYDWSPEDLPTALIKGRQNQEDHITTFPSTVVAVSACTILPYGQKWQLKYNTVHLVPSGHAPRTASRFVEMGRYTHFTLDSVRKIFSRMFQYPAPFLLGPVESMSSLWLAYLQIPILTTYEDLDSFLPVRELNYRSLCNKLRYM